MSSSFDELLDIETVDDTLVIRFTESWMLESQHVHSVQTGLMSLLESYRPARLHLDLGCISYMATPALEMLVILYKRLKSNGAELRLLNLSPQIYEIFRVTQLTKLIDIECAAANV